MLHSCDCSGNAVTELPATPLTDKATQHTTIHVDVHTTMLSATDFGKALPPTSPSTLRTNAATHAYLAACKPRNIQSTEFGVDATSGNSRPTSSDRRRDNFVPPTTDLVGWERSRNQRQRTKAGKHDVMNEGGAESAQLHDSLATHTQDVGGDTAKCVNDVAHMKRQVTSRSSRDGLRACNTSRTTTDKNKSSIVLSGRGND